MNKVSLLSIFIIATFCNVLYAHCQIPCGIYGDELRFKQLDEDFATIEKSMKQIQQLSKNPGQNMNQLVRWVNNKDEHADKVMNTVLHYFLAQRIKAPKTKNDKEMMLYKRKLVLLHKIIVHSMKAKQTTDLKHVEQLRKNLNQFHDLYFNIQQKKHIKHHHK